jgi:hypothetical protein
MKRKSKMLAKLQVSTMNKIRTLPQSAGGVEIKVEK